MVELVNTHAGTILWALGGLYVLQLEIRALFDPNIPTFSAIFWQLIGYSDETRWQLSVPKLLALAGWAVLTSHLFLGIP